MVSVFQLTVIFSETLWWWDTSLSIRFERRNRSGRKLIPGPPVLLRDFIQTRDEAENFSLPKPPFFVNIFKSRLDPWVWLD